jgi:hypothetical protein
MHQSPGWRAVFSQLLAGREREQRHADAVGIMERATDDSGLRELRGFGEMQDAGLRWVEEGWFCHGIQLPRAMIA